MHISNFSGNDCPSWILTHSLNTPSVDIMLAAHNYILHDLSQTNAAASSAWHACSWMQDSDMIYTLLNVNIHIIFLLILHPIKHLHQIPLLCLTQFPFWLHLLCQHTKTLLLHPIKRRNMIHKTQPNWSSRIFTLFAMILKVIFSKHKN